jgi:hypothetical protein
VATASVAVRLNAITGDFEKAFSNATRTVSGFERTFQNAATSIQGHQQSINRAFADFSGDKITREAAALSVAITQIGGAARLTEAEQRKVNATMAEAIEKYRALGLEAPASIQKLAQETQKLSTVTASVEAPVSRTSAFFGDLTNQIKATALGFISAQAVIAGVQTAFRTLTQFVSSSVESFAAAEASQRKLTAALQAQGADVPRVSAQYNKLSEEIQRTTVYSDDLVTEMQALLVQVGNVAPEEMGKAIKAAANLASGLGVDLRQATILVGKAFEGETGTLKRYGIVIDEAKLKAEGLPAVLDAIQAKFGGQAQAEIESYSGQVKQLANEWDNFKEAVGEAIATDPFLRAALDAAKERIKGTSDEAGKGKRSLAEWWIALFGGFKDPQWNAMLIGLDQTLRAMQGIEAEARKLKALNPGTPNLFQPGAGAPTTGIGFDVSAYLKKTEDEMEASKRAAEAYRKSIQSLMDSLSGAKLRGEVSKLQVAWRGLTDEQRRSTPVLERVADAAQKLAEQGADLTPELFQLTLTMGRFQAIMPPVESGMKGIEKEFQDITPAIKASAQQLIDFIGILNDPRLRAVQGLSGLTLPGEKIGSPKIPVPEPQDLTQWRLLSGVIDDIGSHIEGLDGPTQNFVSSMVSGLARVVASGKLTAAAFAEIATSAGYAFLIAKAFEAFSWEPERVDENRLNAFDPFGGQEGFEDAARRAGVTEDRIQLLRRAIEQDIHGLFDREVQFMQDAIEAQERRLDTLGKAVEGVNKKAQLFASSFRKIFDEIGNADSAEAEQKLRAKMAAMAEAGQAEFERLGQYVAVTFAAIVTETGDAIGAITQLAPAFTVLRDGIRDFGLTSTATIDQLLASFNLINDETFGPIFESIQATGQIFTSLQSAGYGTAELFQTVASDIGASFRDIEAKGGDVARAMALSQPILQELWEAQKKYGAVTDETTASLLRQAEEQGLVGEHMRDVNEKILEVLIAIANVFGAVLPASMQETADAAAQTAETIQREFKSVRINIPVDFDINQPTERELRPFNFSSGEGGGDFSASVSGPDSSSATFIMQVDGQTLAEATVPYIPGEVQRFGLA